MKYLAEFIVRFFRAVSEAFELYFVDVNSKNDYKDIGLKYNKRLF